MSIVEMAILSTDLASYFEKRERFLKSANAGEFEWQVQGAHKNFMFFATLPHQSSSGMYVRNVFYIHM